MEDQQPAAGNLTIAADDETQADTAAESTAADTSAAETDSAATDSDQAGNDEATDDTDDTDDTAETAATAATESEGAKKPVAAKKRTGPLVAAVVALLAVLFVGSAAFAGATVQPYLAERANVHTKEKVARAAASAVTTLWSYTPENMDTLSERAAGYLGGDFGAQYRKFIDQIVAPNKQAKITNSTEVTGVAVETLDGANATAIVYTNTTTTSPLKKNIPALKYLAYLLTMKLDNDRWKVVRMNTVTSLDLTPQL